MEASNNSSLTEAKSILVDITNSHEKANGSESVIHNVNRSAGASESTFQMFLHSLSATNATSAGGCPLEELEHKAQDLEAKTEDLRADAETLQHFSPGYSKLYQDLILTITNIQLDLGKDLTKLWLGMGGGG